MSVEQTSLVGTIGRALLITWDDIPARDLEDFESFTELLKTAYGYHITTVKLHAPDADDSTVQEISRLLEPDADTRNPLVVYYAGGYVAKAGTPYLKP